MFSVPTLKQRFSLLILGNIWRWVQLLLGLHAILNCLNNKQSRILDFVQDALWKYKGNIVSYLKESVNICLPNSLKNIYIIIREYIFNRFRSHPNNILFMFGYLIR